VSFLESVSEAGLLVPTASAFATPAGSSIVVIHVIVVVIIVSIQPTAPVSVIEVSRSPRVVMRQVLLRPVATLPRKLAVSPLVPRVLDPVRDGIRTKSSSHGTEDCGHHAWSCFIAMAAPSAARLVSVLEGRLGRLVGHDSPDHGPENACTDTCGRVGKVVVHNAPSAAHGIGTTRSAARPTAIVIIEAAAAIGSGRGTRVARRPRRGAGPAYDRRGRGRHGPWPGVVWSRDAERGGAFAIVVFIQAARLLLWLLLRGRRRGLIVLIKWSCAAAAARMILGGVVAVASRATAAILCFISRHGP